MRWINKRRVGFYMDIKKTGFLITIEGIDGSGKSSAALALADALDVHYPVVLTKEPGGTELGKHLRELLQKRAYGVCPQAEFLLFAADRAQHMTELVLPALNEGKIVISDRMADSSRAYQGFGRGLDDNWITRINQWAMADRTPDLTVYLKIDYKTAASRLKKRNEDATVFEQEKEAFFGRVIDGFEHIFKERSAVLVIDALDREEIVHARMIEAVKEYIAIRFDQNLACMQEPFDASTPWLP